MTATRSAVVRDNERSSFVTARTLEVDRGALARLSTE
jgi:hypothetical protein